MTQVSLISIYLIELPLTVGFDHPNQKGKVYLVQLTSYDVLIRKETSINDIGTVFLCKFERKYLWEIVNGFQSKISRKCWVDRVPSTSYLYDLLTDVLL